MRPRIALVGRPNVGKSALFNRICGKRISIVDEAEGVTRDRLYAPAEWCGRQFELIDTGGIRFRSSDLFAEEIRQQAEIAIEEADSIIQVVDGQMGVTDLDLDVARILLRSGKPICLAVNKIDAECHANLLHDFYSLGIPQMVGVSAIQGGQLAELIEMALPPQSDEEVEAKDNSIKVAIIGRPNVGKSTLINQILQEERCIVSPIPGTTRDSIDTPFSLDGVNYTLIDTAGIRRKKAEPDVVDKFATIRTERAIERADLCVLVIDSQEGLTHQEKRIANQIEAEGKGLILFANKWDLVKGFRMEHSRQAIRTTSSFLDHCPILFGSAKEGRSVGDLFSQIGIVNAEARKHLTTGQLNRFIERALQNNPPPRVDGKRFRIYYMTQMGSQPPRFIFFINHYRLLTPSYEKYLYNQFRQEYQFTGNPIDFRFRSKPGRTEKEDEQTEISARRAKKNSKWQQ